MEYYTRFDQEDFSKKIERSGVDISKIENFTPEIADKIGKLLHQGIINDECYSRGLGEFKFGTGLQPDHLSFNPILDTSKKAIGLNVEIYGTMPIKSRGPELGILNASFYVDYLTKNGKQIPCIRVESNEGYFHHRDFKKNQMVPTPQEANILVPGINETYVGQIIETTQYYDLNDEDLNRKSCHISFIESNSEIYDVNNFYAYADNKSYGVGSGYKESSNYHLAREIMSKPYWAINNGQIISQNQDLNKKSVNDTIRMYKKRNITMYKNVHRYLLLSTFFCYTLF